MSNCIALLFTIYKDLINSALTRSGLFYTYFVFREAVKLTTTYYNKRHSKKMQQETLVWAVFEGYGVIRLVNFHMSVMTNFMMLVLKLTATVTPLFYRKTVS